ncbi:MAG: hypothetical protein LW715_15340, partial [Rhodobacter sp.]|nr:hypothetical protein [Rhodobacter sp.]
MAPDRPHRFMRQPAGGAPRAIGDRYEIGAQRGQHLHRFPQPECGIKRLRREELERKAGGDGHGRLLLLCPCRKSGDVRQFHNTHDQHEVHRRMYLEFRHLRTIRAIHQAGGLARAADML